MFILQILWKFETGGEVKSSPCPGLQDTSVVYVGSHDGALYALDAHVSCNLCGVFVTVTMDYFSFFFNQLSLSNCVVFHRRKR